LTKQRGRTTEEYTDRKNGIKKDTEGQLNPKTEVMNETERKKDSGNNRQGELMKERGGTTTEDKDRKNGQNQEKERHRKL